MIAPIMLFGRVSRKYLARFCKARNIGGGGTKAELAERLAKDIELKWLKHPEIQNSKSCVVWEEARRH